MSDYDMFSGPKDSSIERIISALGAKKMKIGWAAKCPAHDDAHPSLSIALGSNGKILFFCFAGCSQESVLAALCDLGLWNSKQ